MNIDLQVKKKIDGIFPLIAEVDFNVNTLEQFYEDLSSEEILVFDKYELLSILRHYLWKGSILDLCKLFIENEKYSFRRLVNIIVNNYKRVSFKSPLTTKEIFGLYDKTKDFEIYIKHVKEVRDVSVAHKDDKVVFNNLMLYELRALVELAKAIFNPIYAALYDSDFIWLLKEDKRALSLIKNIAKYESIQKLAFRSDLSKKKDIQTADLIKIIDKTYLIRDLTYIDKFKLP
jgi:hypothetical protein